MTGPDKAGALVLDASVLINLLGSGRPELLLRAIPEKVLMADRTFGEVLRDPSGRLPPREIRGALVSGGLIELRALDPDNLDIFIDLAAHPDALDDGEAATIAVAVGCRRGSRAGREKGPSGIPRALSGAAPREFGRSPRLQHAPPELSDQVKPIFNSPGGMPARKTAW